MEASMSPEEITAAIRDIQDRLARIERELKTRGIPASTGDLHDLAVFRIVENGGRIRQRDLQRSLEIGSRTTMSRLVREMRDAGIVRVTRIGRNNYIELVDGYGQ